MFLMSLMSLMSLQFVMFMTTQFSYKLLSAKDTNNKELVRNIN